MGFEPRRLEKFESADASISQTFPLFEFEWESQQDLRSPLAHLVGAHYGFDHRGTSPGLLDFGAERLRCMVYESAGPATVDTSLDALMSKLWSIGQGKLFTIDSAGDRRWAYARLRSMPSISWRAGDILSKGLALDFVRLSPWYGTTAFTHTETVTASPDSFTLAVPGNIDTGLVVVRFRANAIGGFSAGVKLENLTAVHGINYVFESSRASASADSEIRLRTANVGVTGTPDVGYSNDDGASYADDFGNLVLSTDHQVLAFRFAAGNNSMRATVGGTPNVDISFEIYGAWA